MNARLSSGAAMLALLVLMVRFFSAFEHVFLPLAVAGIAALVVEPLYEWLRDRARLPASAALALTFLSIGLPLVGALFLTPLRDYLYEITHDFDGPIEGIVKYLNAHGEDDDVVLVSYGDLPIKYYTGMRVLGGMTMEPLQEAKDADWVIMRKHPLSRQDLRIRQYAMENLERERYEAVELPYPDTMFQNREDPSLHRYRTAQDAENVVILRRR